MKKIIGLLKDWTSLATGLIIGILALQVVLVREGVILYWLEGLCKSNDANDLYLAMLGAAASQASSAGVSWSCSDCQRSRRHSGVCVTQPDGCSLIIGCPLATVAF